MKQRLMTPGPTPVPEDTLLEMAKPVFYHRSATFRQLLNEVTQGSSIAQSVAEGFRVFEGTVDGQNQAVSGVSIDEEAIKMITLQRIYQASARYIQTISELMDILVNI